MGLLYPDGPCNLTETGPVKGSIECQVSDPALEPVVISTCLNVTFFLDSAVDFPQVPNEFITICNSYYC